MIIIRIIAILWALPVSIVGVLIALVCSVHRMEVVNGCLEVDVGRWLPGYAASTWGHVILYAPGVDHQRHRAHEHEHVWQCEIFGALMFALYPIASVVAGLLRIALWSASGFDGEAHLMRYGYYYNVFEWWAREGSK